MPWSGAARRRHDLAPGRPPIREGLSVEMRGLAASFLTTLSVGGLAYVFIYPWLSGERRAAKRQEAMMRSPLERRADRLASGATRREQVAQSLKELEARQKARNSITLEQRIAQAGLDWTRTRFAAMSAVAGVAVALLLLLVTLNTFVAAAGLFAGAFGLPRWLIAYLRKKRMNQFLEELPNALDVIVRGVRAGLPLGDCLRIIASEAQEPVRSEFRSIIEAQALGVPLGDSVVRLYDRVPVAEANFFAIMISIQQKSGGNLAEAVGNLSKVVRERKKMKGKIDAMSTEAKASAAIIGALPFIVAILTYLSSPSYISLLWTTKVGQLALAGSAAWMTVGILVMRKMIRFDF
jgi:tight adherence protein B